MEPTVSVSGTPTVTFKESDVTTGPTVVASGEPSTTASGSPSMSASVAPTASPSASPTLPSTSAVQAVSLRVASNEIMTDNETEAFEDLCATQFLPTYLTRVYANATFEGVACTVLKQSINARRRSLQQSVFDRARLFDLDLLLDVSARTNLPSDVSFTAVVSTVWASYMDDFQAILEEEIPMFDEENAGQYAPIVEGSREASEPTKDSVPPAMIVLIVVGAAASVLIVGSLFMQRKTTLKKKQAAEERMQRMRMFGDGESSQSSLSLWEMAEQGLRPKVQEVKEVPDMIGVVPDMRGFELIPGNRSRSMSDDRISGVTMEKNDGSIQQMRSIDDQSLSTKDTKETKDTKGTKETPKEDSVHTKETRQSNVTEDTASLKGLSLLPSGSVLDRVINMTKTLSNLGVQKTRSDPKERKIPIFAKPPIDKTDLIRKALSSTEEAKASTKPTLNPLSLEEPSSDEPFISPLSPDSMGPTPREAPLSPATMGPEPMEQSNKTFVTKKPRTSKIKMVASPNVKDKIGAKTRARKSKFIASPFKPSKTRSSNSASSSPFQIMSGSDRKFHDLVASTSDLSFEHHSLPTTPTSPRFTFDRLEDCASGSVASGGIRRKHTSAGDHFLQMDLLRRKQRRDQVSPVSGSSSTTGRPPLSPSSHPAGAAMVLRDLDLLRRVSASAETPRHGNIQRDYSMGGIVSYGDDTLSHDEDEF